MKKLYFHPFSPNARRVRIVARLAGVELQEELIDIPGGKNKTPDFLALNANGMVPVLEDGDLVLNESSAICWYLASGRDIAPTKQPDMAQVLRWQFWWHGHFSNPSGGLVMENVFKPMMGGQSDPARIKELEQGFHRFAKVLEGHLAQRDWLELGRLTLADVTIAAGLMWAEAARYPLEDYPRIRALRSRVAELPAWQSTAPPPMPGK